MTRPTTRDELVKQMMQKLSEPLARYDELDRYSTGTQALSFLAPEAKTALGNRFGRMASNIPRVAVTAIAERLRVTGFDGADVWGDWLSNDLDQLSGVAHREALRLGDSFAIVWADRAGRPSVSIESARQVAVAIDPGSRQIRAAVKRWETDTTTEGVLYLDNEIVRLRSDQRGAHTQGYQTVEVIPNPLGVVPVVRFHNSDTLDDGPGMSEIDDLVPLVDGLNKVLHDLMVSSEYVGRPRRWATGVEMIDAPVLDDDGEPVLDDDGFPVTTEVSPYQEGTRMMTAESEGANFGQLDASDLGGYEAAVKVLLSQIMAVSTLPAHYVGILNDQPASADALRAAEASLTARAEARQATFGRSWEQVARLMVAVRTGRDVSAIDNVRVQWADAATRSVAQEADAVTKLFQAGLLPARFALKKLGYSDSDIAEIEAARTPTTERETA